MPIVKYIAVHTTPVYTLEYIVNGDKTDEMKYVTGINCPTNAEEAYDFFQRNFEKYSGERFYKKVVDDESKERIRIHHYVQSFSPEENITPEEANRIGIEWAKKVFGNDYQVIVSTHVDKKHIHNHFAVSPYSIDGKAWYANYKSLKKCRAISDEIAKSHGLDIIEKPKHKNTMKYNEWLARQNGTSWKAKAAEKIDELILRSDVLSIDDLAEKLREENYNVRLGKYMTIRLESMERGVRTYRLGDGYGIEELKYRIQHKECEISKAAISRLSGNQKIYALYMRQMQIQVFHHKSKKVTYADLTKSANLLTYLTENNITSVDELKDNVDASNLNYLNSKDICKFLDKQLSQEQNLDKRKELEQQLSEETLKMAKLKLERDKVAELYKTYLRHTSENAYERILREVTEEHNYIQQESEQEHLSENKNLAHTEHKDRNQNNGGKEL